MNVSNAFRDACAVLANDESCSVGLHSIHSGQWTVFYTFCLYAELRLSVDAVFSRKKLRHYNHFHAAQRCMNRSKLRTERRRILCQVVLTLWHNYSRRQQIYSLFASCTTWLMPCMPYRDDTGTHLMIVQYRPTVADRSVTRAAGTRPLNFHLMAAIFWSSTSSLRAYISLMYESRTEDQQPYRGFLNFLLSP